MTTAIISDSAVGVDTVAAAIAAAAADIAIAIHCYCRVVAVLVLCIFATVIFQAGGVCPHSSLILSQ